MADEVKEVAENEVNSEEDYRYIELAKCANKIHEVARHISDFLNKIKLDITPRELLSAAYILVTEKDIVYLKDKELQDILKLVIKRISNKKFDSDKFRSACKLVSSFRLAEKLAKKEMLKEKGYSEKEIAGGMNFNLLYWS